MSSPHNPPTGDKSRTMNAWQYDKAQAPMEAHLRLNENTACPPTDPLPAGKSLIRVITAALNPVDWKLPEIPFVGGLAAKTPATPAIDFCGRLLKPDPRRDGLKVRQLVFGRLDKPCQFGTLADQTVVPSDGCVPVPDGVNPDQAASIGTAGLTAYQCIVPFLGPVTTDSRIFINGGSGGVGTWGIQIAKAHGCYVSASCSTANVSLCQELGADEVLDYNKVDVAKTLAENHKDAPFDLIVDAVGTPENLYHASERFLQPQGYFIQPAGTPSLSQLMELADKMIRPSWLGGGKRPFRFMAVRNNRGDFSNIAALIRDGKVKPVVEEKYAFDDVMKAYKHLKTGRARGKLLVKVGSI